jgi:SAM-dependent methyltransferase
MRVKRLIDGRALINLGCGTRTHWAWNNLDSSPYARIRRHRSVAVFLKRVGVLSTLRFKRLEAMDPDIIYWDLRRGIPFEDQTFDIVYHSHLLEHVDRDQARKFLKECRRVLKSNSVLRVVVPDLESLVHQYLGAVAALDKREEEADVRHRQAVCELFEQMVRKEAAGIAMQRPWVRVLERLLRRGGSAAQAGELHRWMYDRHSLGSLLSDVGFREIKRVDAFVSRVEGWTSFNLDTEPDGSIYKPNSLYMEAIK